MPLMTMNSNALSSIAESEPSWLMIGRTLYMSDLKNLVSMFSSRAIILSTLPRMVLISPLCTMIRFGWARIQLGFVLVLKRECTVAMADS